MGIKDSAKSKRFSTCIKNFEEIITTRSKMAASGVTVLKSQFFHKITKISKTRNTTTKNNIYHKIIHFNIYFFIFL